MVIVGISGDLGWWHRAGALLDRGSAGQQPAGQLGVGCWRRRGLRAGWRLDGEMDVG